MTYRTLKTIGIALALIATLTLGAPAPSVSAAEEHTKGKRKSTHDKHTKRRPGQRGKKSKIPRNPNKRVPRGGSTTVGTVGTLVAIEGAVYLVELSYEYNQLATGPISDPDFTFIDQDEADLIGLNVTSSGYWNGVWDYWTGW